MGREKLELTSEVKLELTEEQLIEIRDALYDRAKQSLRIASEAWLVPTDEEIDELDSLCDTVAALWRISSAMKEHDKEQTEIANKLANKPLKKEGKK